MSQPFTFPPPPPPPPKQSSNHTLQQQSNGRGAHRGRGNFANFSQNNRGGDSRGQYPSRGSQRGGHGSRGNGVNQPGTGHWSYNRNYQNTSRHHNPQDSLQASSPNSAQKRPYSAAFNSQSSNHVAKSRPSAPPAVPSFGIDFDALLPKKPDLPKSTAIPVPRKPNLLGLTPVAQTSDSESDDDHEEESKLANAFASDNVLQFEYRGETSSLKTPEEIAKWIAERRKKWPTEAKRETARKEAEERKKSMDAEKAARLEASKAAAKVRQEERIKQKLEKEKSVVRQKLLREQIQKANRKATGNPSNMVQNAAQMKAEKLKKKAQKIAHQLKIAEESLAKQEQGASQGADQDMNDIDVLVAQVDRIAAAQQNPNRPSTNDPALDLSDMSSLSDSDSSHSSDPEARAAADDTTTSGSSSDSDSDSDSSPEQISSKQAPRPVNPPKAASTDTRALCTNFTKTGRCKFGRRCHFRHDKADRKAVLAKEPGTGSNGRRKGLYQVMVEKEKETERKRALRVIIALGDAGLLDEGKEVDHDDKDKEFDQVKA